MNERSRGKYALWFSGATAALSLCAMHLLENEPTQADFTSVTELSTPTTYSDPDILRICRIASSGVIDQVCALEQATKEIAAQDDVMAGIWAYHVTEPSLSFELDLFEVEQTQLAAVAGKTGECALWANRVMDPFLRERLPVCE